MQFYPFIFSNEMEDLEVADADNDLEFDGVHLQDLYTVIKKKTFNSKKTWNVWIKNAEIYFTTRTSEILRVIKYVHIVENMLQMVMYL